MDDSTNNVSMEDETDVADCDGEPVVTMMDVLKEQQEFEEDANAVLGASDDKNCTFLKGYVKRQAVYACLTCCNDARFDPTKRAGICLACSLNCHENHELVELYTKRNFRCDCGNPKFSNHPCQFNSDKNELNEDNKYNQNFSGLYCICNRPYPDPESSVEDEMIQCIICEDWLHASHLDAMIPSNGQYAEMICKRCMDENEFLHDYSCYSVNSNSESEEVNVDIYENEVSPQASNGKLSPNKSDVNEIIETSTSETEINQESSKSEPELNKMDIDQATESMSNLDETEMRKEIEISAKIDENCEKKDNCSPEIENESYKINDTASTRNSSELEVNGKNESPGIDEKKRDTNDSLKIDGIKNNNVVSTISELAQHEPSEENMCAENKVNSNVITTTPNNILPENDANEEIMSEIDKILGSPHELESTASEPEKHDALETSATESEQQNSDANKVKTDESAIGNQASEYESVTNIEEKVLLIKENCVEPNETINEDNCEETDTEKLLFDEDDKGHEEINDIIPEKKDAEIFEDKLEESLSTEKCESIHQDTIQKTVAHAEENEKSSIEEHITSTESNIEKQDENTISTTASDDIENASKIEQPEPEKDVHIIVPNQTIDLNSDSNAKSNTEDIGDESDCKQDTCENNSDTNSKLQLNESFLDAPDAGIPVITEINSVNENIESDNQNQPLKENKRKMSEEEAETLFCNKKKKIDCNETICHKPKNAKRKFKGATFWPSDFRQKLCTCNECLTMYKELSVLFLIDPEDTVTAYEALGQAKIGSTQTQYEKGLEALSSLDRTLQINALTEYNKLRDKFLDFLKGFKDRKEIVKEEDIKLFFAKLKPRKESDGIYFCK